MHANPKAAHALLATMTLADSHVKMLLKEGTATAGAPPSGSEWRISPEAIARAKELAEDHIRRLASDATRRCAQAKRSTLKAEDFVEGGPTPPETAGMMG